MGDTESSVSSAPVPNLRVLVADDDVLAATGIATLLGRSGFSVLGPVADGQSAIDIAREQRPDVCMLDIDMPVVDGLVAARRIINEFDIPVIMLSAHSDERHVAQATEAGVFGYMVKPSSQNQLRAAISIALSMHAARRDDKAAVARLQRQAETRRLVEQAKWKLVSEKGLTEPAAHTLLQDRARDQRRRIEDIAREVLGVSDGARAEMRESRSSAHG